MGAGRSVSEALGQGRATTPRRGREGAARLGSGLSPKAKRPNVIGAPVPAAPPGQMSGDEIVAMLHGLKAQQDQMSSWSESVNSTLHSHADGLEGAHKEFVMIRGEIRQAAEAADAKTETIAQRIAELFSKTDELLGSISRSESELRGLIDVRLTEIQTRVAELEISGSSSGSSGPAAPPGLIAEGVKLSLLLRG